MLWLYVQARVLPPLALPMLCLSKRLHSIYLLRLFNDGPAMLLAYGATALLVAQRWVPAIVAFSAAVSIKMNVLLMAPSVLLIVLKVCFVVLSHSWHAESCVVLRPCLWLSAGCRPSSPSARRCPSK